MAGATIAINDAAADDTLLSVKQRVFAANRTLFVRRQRLVYTAGPRGMDALADDETLGSAGVAQDGTAKLDVLVADLTAAEAAELGKKVSCGWNTWKAVIMVWCFRFFDHARGHYCHSQLQFTLFSRGSIALPWSMKLILFLSYFHSLIFAYSLKSAAGSRDRGLRQRYWHSYGRGRHY
jgi:hypothetical protein